MIWRCSWKPLPYQNVGPGAAYQQAHGRDLLLLYAGSTTATAKASVVIAGHLTMLLREQGAVTPIVYDLPADPQQVRTA